MRKAQTLRVNDLYAMLAKCRKHLTTFWILRTVINYYDFYRDPCKAADAR
jgi:hypothetical protein